MECCVMQENTIETGARLLKLYPNLSVLFGTTFLSSIVIPKMRMKIWIIRLLYPKSKSSLNENVKNFKYQLNVTNDLCKNIDKEIHQQIRIWLSQTYGRDKFNGRWLPWNLASLKITLSKAGLKFFLKLQNCIPKNWPKEHSLSRILDLRNCLQSKNYSFNSVIINFLPLLELREFLL